MKKLIPWVLGVVILTLYSCGEPIQPDKPDTPTSVSFNVQPASLSFTGDGGTQTVTLTTDSKSWKATVTGDWAAVNPSSGSGNQTITVTVPENSSERRMLTLSFSDASGLKGTASVSIVQEAKEQATTEIIPSPADFDGTKRSSTAYQLLVYSFADSNGDGVGDFKGIQGKLDYLDALGVTALWLSPAHPTGSYHAYDVNDYSTVNPLYGTEADFKALVDAAHSKGISIYMDYVLNHSGSGNEWFKEACADVESPYRDWYVFSDNPEADVAAGKIDNYAGAKDPKMGAWHEITVGKAGYKGRLHFKVDWTGGTKYVTVTETQEAAQKPNSSAKMWLWIGSSGNVGLYETSAGIYEITLDVDTEWGFLVRSSNSDSWPSGTKYGSPSGSGPIKMGQAFKLDNSGSCGDITFGGSKSWYFASFDRSMPDLNYGNYTECENSPAFKAIAATADRWITEFGVDGFRLDAVLWIYQSQLTANQRFLQQWYDHCNATYKAAGHSGDIFMVGEAWEGHNIEKMYYKGLISNFEFDYGYKVRDVLNNQNAAGFVSSVAGYVSDHTAQRADAITTFFLSNHDQNRFGSEVGKNVAKMKQAGAMLLSGPGKPFIYQGEELGYTGVKDNGDEYVRIPMLWDKAGKDCAKKGVNNKVDGNVLTAAISVESQQADDASILNVYKDWSRLRNTYPALAEGSMSAANVSGSTIAAWYMTSGSQKLLVIHNVAASAKTVAVSDDMSKPIALLGNASVKGNALTIGGNSSVVFELK
ncbi:MAG: alpha-amylase [Bacteroidales bacterium]|nr:alpha-amylase [Bacteroidales bacterium]